MTDLRLDTAAPPAHPGAYAWHERPVGSVQSHPRSHLSLPALDHVGILVADLSSAAEDFERCWGAVAVEVGQLTLCDACCFGRPVEVSLRRAFIRHSGADIELIQPLRGSSRYLDFFQDRHSAGVHHLAYLVDDIDLHLQRLRPVGSELALDAQLPDRRGRVVQVRGFAHGPCIELIQLALPRSET